MDSFKTGEFIKSLRIEKGLTQKELAEALNCTDKAISRWETGKGFPDIVFLAPLAKTLGVTVNELLAGEKLSQEELESKSDEVIINTMQEAEKNAKKIQNIIFVILCVFQAIMIYGTLIFRKSLSGDLASIFIILSIFVGLLKTKLKFAFPLITSLLFLPTLLIEDLTYSFTFVLIMVFIFGGIFTISITSLIKAIIVGIHGVWKKQHKVIKVLISAIIIIAIVVCIVGGMRDSENKEAIIKVDVIEYIHNEETYIHELKYNGTTYYSSDNYISQHYKDILDEGEFVSQHFPRNMEPYSLDLQKVDLSNCTDFLPKLPEGQEYSIEKESYYIYAKDSVIKPSMIYACGDSYEEWFISEDFDFTMPTIETHDIADIVVYERYGGNFICITDEEKISEIITIKNNREDISKYVTTEEYGDWFDIRIRYENSPFTERIGVLREDGTFVYTESLQEKYEENPYWYYSLEYENPYWSNFS